MEDEYVKNFDSWNGKKKHINSSKRKPFPKEGSVWICSLGLNIGSEIDGTGESFSRPVLVLKKFNTKMYWVVPFSSKHQSFDFYYNFIDPNGNKAAAILSQLRLVSQKRFFRPLYRLTNAEIEDVINKLIDFLEKSKPRTDKMRGISSPKRDTVNRNSTEAENLGTF